MELKDIKDLGITENIDDIPTQAIDLVDGMLAQLPERDRYGMRGDVLRYILSVLQERR